MPSWPPARLASPHLQCCLIYPCRPHPSLGPIQPSESMMKTVEMAIGLPCMEMRTEPWNATIGYDLALVTETNLIHMMDFHKLGCHFFISQIFIWTWATQKVWKSKTHIVKSDDRQIPPRTREIPPLTREVPSPKFWGFHIIYENVPLWVYEPTFIEFMKANYWEWLEHRS